MPQTSCSQCNAWYNSERDLRDHLRTVHRKFGSEQSSSEPGDSALAIVAAPVNQPVR
jgi:hypothetical protein